MNKRKALRTRIPPTGSVAQQRIRQLEKRIRQLEDKNNLLEEEIEQMTENEMRELLR